VSLPQVDLGKEDGDALGGDLRGPAHLLAERA
jgi:hypothetical protein